MSRENKDQIPTERNVEHIADVLRKQEGVEGMQRDDMMVHDFPKAAALAQVLKNVTFPADKSKIMEYLSTSFPENSTMSRAETIALVDKIFDDRQYYNVFEVVEAARLADSSAA
ncbi:MAG: DUF2795 domain-containing protein [Nitrososphaera sp.]|jgi:hypothetical protein